MVSPLIKAVGYRGLLPLSLLFAAFIRPSFISIFYVVLAIVSPTLPSIPKSSPVPGSIRAYVVISLVYSLICALFQLAYQIYEPLQRPDEDSYQKLCNESNFEVDWLKYSGFIRFRGGHGFNSARAILPEIVAFASSLVTFLLVCVLSHVEEEVEAPASVQQVRSGDDVLDLDNSNRASAGGPTLAGVSTALKRLSNVAIIIVAALVGSVQPSLLNSVYFLAFLFTASWWGMYKPLRHRSYNVVKRFLLFFAAVHMCIIYSYQISIVQTWIPAEGLAARLIGLSPIFLTDCNTWWSFWFNPHLQWPAFANPVVLLLFYHLLMLQLMWTRDGSRYYVEQDTTGSSVHEELLSSEDQEQDGANLQTHIPLRKVTSQVVDRHKINKMIQGERAAGGSDSPASEALVAIFFFTLYHSYVFSLLAMMTWALLYHSIFGLILLIIACVLWMFKDTRSASFVVSPLIVAYVEFLLLLQYVCSMNLNSSELNFSDLLQMFGFVLAGTMEKGFVTLGVKLLLSLPVFLLLRLYRRESFYNSLTEHERSQRIQSYGTFSSNRTRTNTAEVGEAAARKRSKWNSSQFFVWLSRQLSVLWIFFVGFILLCVGLQTHPVLYSIGFFAIWSLCILYLKVSLRFFRGVAYLFWLSTILYTSVVIITLYVYQFPGFPEDWIRWTGISKEWNDDIGLINYASIGENSGLFVRLVWPISLFVVTMLQLKFFHEPWAFMVQPVRDAAETDLPEGATLTQKIVKWTNDLLELIWRVTEVHISKIVFIIIAIFIANNVCALYLPLMVLICLALCLPRAASNVLSLVMCAYLCVVALFKMIYQINHFPNFDDLFEADCNVTHPFSKWLGVEKNAQTWHLLNGLVVSIIALGAQSVVVYRQRHHRQRRGEPEQMKDFVFPTFEMQDLDRSIWDGMKFLIDYGFYKFGFEISVGMMALDAWMRMDMLGAVMAVWMAFFALSKRPVARVVWPFFVLYLAIILPVQYAFYVGLPQNTCIDYPWSTIFPENKSYSAATVNCNFDIWAGLSNYDVIWPPNNLVADFFLLLFASCQMLVFRMEKEENDTIYPDGQYYFKPENPHYDFIAEQRSFVDFVKIIIFHYGHWITLIATLVAGIGGTSVFALGYIMLTFWILWQGNNLYVMNAHTNSFKSTLARWNTLVTYTVFTIFCKVALQFVGCVHLYWFDPGSRCTLRQIFSITCVNTIINDRKQPLFDGEADFDRRCPVAAQEAQIGFDAVALTFLVLQLRAFHSWYFQHCMLEYRSEVILANRGAVLKNQLVEKEMKEQNIQQSEKFNEIQRRTQAIRQRYNEQQAKGGGVFEPETYGQAKRAGDYYMFDYDPNSDELVQPVESFVPEAEPGATEFDKLDPGQLVYAAASKDMDMNRALEAVAEAEKVKDAERRMIEVIRERDGQGSAATSPVAGQGERETRMGELDVDTTQESEMPAVKESKVLSVFRFIQKILVNGSDMISVFLNRMSREHRYVAFVLSKEKEKLKDNHIESLSNTSLKLNELRSQMDMPSLQLVHTESDIEKMESEAQSTWHRRSAIARLMTAIGNCIAANTEMLCYFLAVLAHAMGAGLLTLPLPLMVFLWGSLSNPRPSKFFWVSMIAYTEFVIMVKFICQFTFFDFNKEASTNKNVVNPMTVPKIFGVQRQNNFALFDVPLLFALFFHRYMLRKLGLWKDANRTTTFNESIINNDGTTMETIHSRTNSATSAVEQPTTSGNEVAVPNNENNETETVQESSVEKSKNPILRFIHQLFRPKFRYIRDLYPIMFGLDVFAFFIISFGYSGFGEGGSGNVIGDIQKSRIPLTLVVMLIVMTLMIVIDRGLYLRKWVYGKLAYQLIIIVFIHTWIFFVLPEITRRSAAENHVAQFLYIVKCTYLIVSAWQIRNGYPQLCIGNLLTHAYGLTNMIFFKVFMAVPFLFELRTAIDWTWTDTSMPLFDFFNMENFYAVIYNLKCARTFENNYPAPRGQPKGMIVKYFMGLPMILGIVLLVWLPLLIFSLLNQIGDISIPNRVTMSMSLEGYPPLYQIEAQGEELRPFTDTEQRRLTEVMGERFFSDETESLKRSRNSVSFLKDYTENDVLVVEFRPESQVVWPISAESLNALKNQLQSNSSLNFQLSVEFSRPYDPKKKVSEKHATQWNQKLSMDKAVRQKIIDALDGNGQIVLKEAFPSYMLVPNEGEVGVPEPLVASILYDQDKTTPQNVSKTAWFDQLTLNIQNGSAAGVTKVWVAQSRHPSQYDSDLFFNASTVPYGTGLEYLQTVAFVDRAYPSFFAKYLQGGVITMYVTVVIVVGRLIRGVFTNSPTDVMINEIPNPDYLLKICLDIYLVREAKDFFLEQDLFAKLIFLFRSPATLIQWTRYKVKND